MLGYPFGRASLLNPQERAFQALQDLNHYSLAKKKTVRLSDLKSILAFNLRVQNFDPNAWSIEDPRYKEVVESIAGKGNTLHPVKFLERGNELKSAVCKVTLQQGSATGFLVDENVMLTNHHVIGEATDLTKVVCIFDLDGPGAITEQRRASKLLRTDKTLDYSLVLLERSTKAGRPIIPLLQNVVSVSEKCISIGHPNGEDKKLSLLKNEVIDPAYRDDSILYMTDSLPGSSGSPIFAPDWTLIALHRAEIETIWGERRNVGTQISKIVADIKALNRPDLTSLVLH